MGGRLIVPLERVQTVSRDQPRIRLVPAAGEVRVDFPGGRQREPVLAEPEQSPTQHEEASAGALVGGKLGEPLEVLLGAREVAPIVGLSARLKQPLRRGGIQTPDLGDRGPGTQNSSREDDEENEPPRRPHGGVGRLAATELWSVCLIHGLAEHCRFGGRI